MLKEKTITFASGMKVSPYSDVCNDGELSLLENMEVHAGGLRPARLMPKPGSADYSFMKEGYKLLYVHTMNDRKNLILWKDDVLWWWSELTSEQDPAMIDGATYTEQENPELISLGTQIAIKSDLKDDTYVSWNGEGYTYVSSSAERWSQAGLRFGMSKNAKIRFVSCDEVGKYSGYDVQKYNETWNLGSFISDVVVYNCNIKDTKENKKYFQNVSLQAIAKCQEKLQFQLPFFMRYAVKDKLDNTIYLSPPVLIIPNYPAPLLITKPAECDSLPHHSMVCTYISATTEIDPKEENHNKVSNVRLSKATGASDLIINGDTEAFLDIYISSPIHVGNYENGWLGIANPFKMTMPKPLSPLPDLENYCVYIQGQFRAKVYEIGQNNGQQYSGDYIFDAHSLKQIVSLGNDTVGRQDANWFDALLEYTNNLNKSNVNIFRYLYLQSYLMHPAKSKDLEEQVKNAVQDASFHRVKRYDLQKYVGKDISTVLEDSIRFDNTYEEGISLAINASVNTKTLGGHYFRYNNRIFKYAHTEQEKYTYYKTEEALARKNIFHQTRGNVSSQMYAYGSQYHSSEGKYVELWHPLIMPIKDQDYKAATVTFDVEGLSVVSEGNLTEGKILFNAVWYVGSNNKIYAEIIGNITEHATITPGMYAPMMFYSYPYANAYQAQIVVEEEGQLKLWTLNLTKSETSRDLAYWCFFENKENYTVTDITQAQYESIKQEALKNSQPDENRHNMNEVDVSEPYSLNDAGFKDENRQQRIGMGTILTFAVQQNAISQGQFGTVQLVAFCSDGNYAVSISDTGTISAVHPMVGPVLVNRDSVISTAEAIYYYSEEGLVRLSGNSYAIISEALEGEIDYEEPDGEGGQSHSFVIKDADDAEKTETLSFHEALSRSIAINDASNDRIMFAVRGCNKIVVLSTKTQTYSILNTENPVSRVINEHPYSYVQFEDNNLMNLGGRLDYKGDDDAIYEGELVSRPIKMDTIDLKAVKEMLLQGTFSEKQEITLQATNAISHTPGVETKWTTIGRTTNKRVPHIVGRWFKYWRVIIKTKLHEYENITGITFRYEVRTDGRLR